MRHDVLPVSTEDDRIPPSRRGVLRASLGAGIAAVTAAGFGAAGSAFAGSARASERAFSAARCDAMPTSTRLLWRADTDEKVLALTFDDGPDPRFTPQLLDVLERERVPATFFVCGRQVQAHPELLRREVAAGHEIGNHSWSHLDLAAATEQEVRSELTRTSEVVEQVGGVRPRILRPPWGRISGVAMHVAAALAMDVVVWDVRLLDLEHDHATTVDHVRRHLVPGTVLLGHDSGPASRAIGIGAMPEIIANARARGYRFVRASEMLALDRTASSR